MLLTLLILGGSGGCCCCCCGCGGGNGVVDDDFTVLLRKDAVLFPSSKKTEGTGTTAKKTHVNTPYAIEEQVGISLLRLLLSNMMVP